MARELELLNYEATMARCSNSALKLVIWWGNNIGGGTMLISENELKESADLSIAYWKKTDCTLSLYQWQRQGMV